MRYCCRAAYAVGRLPLTRLNRLCSVHCIPVAAAAAAADRLALKGKIDPLFALKAPPPIPKKRRNDRSTRHPSEVRPSDRRPKWIGDHFVARFFYPLWLHSSLAHVAHVRIDFKMPRFSPLSPQSTPVIKISRARPPFILDH